ncbi:MAG TPA: glycosyltransferase family 1 protein [Bacteroidia bacterium]|jgi:glycosyltransferase involved in cell wall biosynthesis|nr:glycosyltransferase family 1 protein [Bacteroidia bacterium]
MRKVLLEMEKLKDPYSGLGQFCLHLGEQFQLIDPAEPELTFYLPGDKKNIFGNKFHYKEHSSLHKLFKLKGSEYDVWHCLHQGSHYLPTDKKTKLLLTIHDLNFLEKYAGAKQQNKLKMLQQKVDRASAITVISKFTESIARKNLDLKNKPVHVIHNGNSLKTFSEVPKPSFINFQEFIFSIGIVSPKKNFATLIPLLKHNKELHLVIAGNNSSAHANELIDLAKKAGVNGRFHLVGTIDERTKYWLYKNCKAFVFPSLTEGFGLPVVEAMSLGKPVFLSDLTSLPEVGGKEAYYWTDFDPGEMNQVFLNGMRSFGADPGKVDRSIMWAGQFSWRKAAVSYLSLYRSL